MSKVAYEDRYAQIRQMAKTNRSICYWRNNLSIKDFKEEKDRYVFEDTGNYNGLEVWMRISVKKRYVRRLFKRKRKGVIEFWGNLKHMGIMVRLRTKKFPRIHTGSEGWLTYEFSMDGTTDGLIFIDDKALKRCRKEAEPERIQRTKKARKKEDYFDEEIYEKEAC